MMLKIIAAVLTAKEKRNALMGLVIREFSVSNQTCIIYFISFRAKQVCVCQYCK